MFAAGAVVLFSLAVFLLQANAAVPGEVVCSESDLTELSLLREENPILKQQLADVKAEKYSTYQLSETIWSSYIDCFWAFTCTVEPERCLHEYNYTETDAENFAEYCAAAYYGDFEASALDILRVEYVGGN